MTWADDRDECFAIADWLGVSEQRVIDARNDLGWTWAQMLDRLQDQAEAANNYLDGLDVDLHPDPSLPDWLNYYHPSGV